MILHHTQLRQPTGGLVTEELHPLEEMGGMGDFETYLAASVGEVPAILFPDGDCSKFVENYDLQRNGLFDPYDCVTCAHQSQIDCLTTVRNWLLDKQSRRVTALDAGTKPGIGTSNSKVENAIQKRMVAEADCPSITPTMSSQQFFAPLPPLKDDFVKDFEVGFFKVPTIDGLTATRNNLANILIYSPIVVSVNGHYEFDSNGYLIRTSPEDNHDVLLVRLATPSQPFDLIFDSENPSGFVKVNPRYDYHFPVFGYIKKKNMFQLVKETGLPAVYLYSSMLDKYFAISDSEPMTDVDGNQFVIQGGDVLKCFSGDYKNARINVQPTIDHSKIAGIIQIKLN